MLSNVILKFCHLLYSMDRHRAAEDGLYFMYGHRKRWTKKCNVVIHERTASSLIEDWTVPGKGELFWRIYERHCL